VFHTADNKLEIFKDSKHTKKPEMSFHVKEIKSIWLDDQYRFNKNGAKQESGHETIDTDGKHHLLCFEEAARWNKVAFGSLPKVEHPKYAAALGGIRHFLGQ